MEAAKTRGGIQECFENVSPPHVAWRTRGRAIETLRVNLRGFAARLSDGVTWSRLNDVATISAAPGAWGFSQPPRSSERTYLAGAALPSLSRGQTQTCSSSSCWTAKSTCSTGLLSGTLSRRVWAWRRPGGCCLGHGGHRRTHGKGGLAGTP